MNRLKYLLLLVPFLLYSCGTSKKVTESVMDTKKLTVEQMVSTLENKAVTDEFLTAKMNFHFKSGSQDLSVGGNLKMKKNDVIQLSLVALGIMEAARIEFSPQDVLVIDRLNKRYIKASYNEFSFLKEAGIDFSALESLFRNSIFVPENKTDLSLDYSLKDNVTVICQNKRLKFKFLTSLSTSLIQQTQVMSAGNGKGELDWVYSDFTSFKEKQFPLSHQIKLTGMGKDAEIEIQLKNLGSDSKWEPHTAVKSSYKEMKTTDILKMLHF